MLRKIQASLVVLAALLLSPSLFGQAYRVDPPQAQIVGSAPPAGFPQLFGIPYARVTLCGYPANATPCTNFASSYTDATAAVLCPQGSNVVINGTNTCQGTTDSGGMAGFWVLPGNYSYMLTVQSTGKTYGPFNFSAGTSSISGNFCPLSGCTFTGAIAGTNASFSGAVSGVTGTFGTLNSISNAAVAPGGDIGAKINSALAACSSQCTVYVPAGTYPFLTPIVLPMNALGTYDLWLDDGAVLQYSGTGVAITGSINTGGPTITLLKIHGGQLAGTASAAAGIEIFPSNSTWVTNMTISGFGAGYGIWVNGANAVNIHDNTILNNLIGVFGSSTFCSGNVCNPTGGGLAYTPNAVHIDHNTITGNAQWGIQFIDFTTGALTGALNDVIAENDLEVNGSAGSTFGAIDVNRSTGLIVRGNYFEGSPRQVVLGYPGSPGSFFGSFGAVVRDNYFTLLNITPYEIEAQDTTNLTVEGNSTLGASIQNTGACFLNETEAVGTYFGKNHVVTTATGSTGSVSPLCQAGTSENQLAGAGSYSIVNPNYNWFVVNNNYQLASAGTSEVVAVGSAGGVVNVGVPCRADPFNATAGAVGLNGIYVIATGAGSVTFFHPSAINGTRWTISCSPGAYN